jgi:hypothetical protein
MMGLVTMLTATSVAICGPVQGQGTAPPSFTSTPADAVPLPESGALAPGVYLETQHLGPDVRLAVGDGWVVADVGVAEGKGFTLSWGGSGRHTLAVTIFDGRIHVAPCHTPREGLSGDSADMDVRAWLVDPTHVVSIEATPEALWEHLRANPNVDVGELTEVQVGGLDGLQGELLGDVGDGCYHQTTYLWSPPGGGAWYFEDGTQARYTVLDIGDQVVVLAAESLADSADREAFLQAVDAVIPTVAIDVDDATS